MVHKEISQPIQKSFIEILRKKEDIFSEKYLWGAWGFDQIFIQGDFYNSPLIQWHAEQSLRFIRPKEKIKKIVENFKNDYFTKPTLGIHIRHGNGEKGNFEKENRIIQDQNAFVKKAIDHLKEVGKKDFGTDFQIFLCTDSQEIIDIFQEMYPETIYRKINLPIKGQGGFLAVQSDTIVTIEDPIKSLEDSLIDMLLLAECDFLSLSERSAFSFLPFLLQKKNGRTNFRKI